MKEVFMLTVVTIAVALASLVIVPVEKVQVQKINAPIVCKLLF